MKFLGKKTKEIESANKALKEFQNEEKAKKTSIDSIALVNFIKASGDKSMIEGIQPIIQQLQSDPKNAAVLQTALSDAIRVYRNHPRGGAVKLFDILVEIGESKNLEKEYEAFGEKIFTHLQKYKLMDAIDETKKLGVSEETAMKYVKDFLWSLWKASETPTQERLDWLSNVQIEAAQSKNVTVFNDTQKLIEHCKLLNIVKQ